MSAQNDIPVEIQGYVTDPKLVGFQPLTNYESTYWRALVGNDAWSLYEVLRSFCHQGKNTCRPSINLLMAILGLKQRRVLTGWATKVKGKEYRYSGSIEILQKYKLVVAEVKGKGAKMSYLFHVNLTPSLLTNEQLSKLPNLLQKKHDELLKRCEQAIQELEAKRRPPKIPEATKGLEGYDNLSQGYDNLSQGYDNLSPKQQQVNNTHITTTEVVVALTNKGISKNVTKQLVNNYSRKRILEKIEYLEYLQETDPKKVTNPRGWLRRAIEDDYGKPDGFKSRTEREAEAAAAEKRRQAIIEQEKQRAAQEEEKREQERREREEKLTQFRRDYKTSEATQKVWSEWKSQIRARTTLGKSLVLNDCELLALQDTQVVLWAATDYAVKEFNRLHAPTIRKLAAKHLKIPLTTVEIKLITSAQHTEDTDP